MVFSSRHGEQDDPESGQLLKTEKYDDDLEKKVPEKAGAPSFVSVAIWTMINVISTVAIVSPHSPSYTPYAVFRKLT